MPELVDMHRSAVFSSCRTWRYALYRIWDESKPLLVVIGLNPSTADETLDDPTIRRCIRFARDWGYGGLVMLNLFAFRSTDPAGLRSTADPCGPENDQHLLKETEGRRVLCSWGTHGSLLGRDSKVTAMLTKAGRELVCLGRTKDGYPRHPLYVRADTQPEPWGRT